MTSHVIQNRLVLYHKNKTDDPAADMNILKSILGKTRMNTVPNKEKFNITDSVKFIKSRRRPK